MLFGYFFLFLWLQLTCKPPCPWAVTLIADGDHEGVVRIFVALSCEQWGYLHYLHYLHYAAQFFPYQECNLLYFFFIVVCFFCTISLYLSQGCHNRASRPDSEHIITEQYPNCVNYMVTMPYILYIVSGVWVHITLVPRGCMLSVYKALYPYVTREVLMNVIMNLPYVGRPHYRCEPWQGRVTIMSRQGGFWNNWFVLGTFIILATHVSLHSASIIIKKRSVMISAERNKA